MLIDNSVLTSVFCQNDVLQTTYVLAKLQTLRFQCFNKCKETKTSILASSLDKKRVILGSKELIEQY